MPPTDPHIARRLETVRARAGMRRGPLPLEELVALSGVGFDALSEVVGAVSITDAPGGFLSSGYIPSEKIPDRTYTSSPPNQRVGMPATLTTRRTAFNRAMSRLQAEAQALGADGVIAIEVEKSHWHAQQANAEFGTFNLVLHGIAVRGVGRRHPETPFTTSMSGTQFASCLRNGVVPVSFLQTPCMAIRHIDSVSARQQRLTADNGEIDALTDVVSVCRRQARADFTAAARRAGADSAVIDSITLQIHGEGRAPNHCTAEVVVTGTALAHFKLPPHAPPSFLTILPLTDPRSGATE
ncbi:hypothetical protein SAMN05444157_0759 [Frankineae bacterium MT45]|nr:hypothetical protein SAMN05444157_0759 [Frankineae bacterium MT45]